MFMASTDLYLKLTVPLRERFDARLALRERRAQASAHKRARRDDFLEDCRALLEVFPMLREGPTCKLYALRRAALAARLPRHVLVA